MKLKTKLLTAGLLVCISSPALAQSPTGFYVGAMAGADWMRDADVTGTGLPVFEAEHDLGFAILGNVGYDLGQPRFELEFGYRANGVDQFNVPGRRAADGDIDQFHVMANAYYDVPTGTAFTPYLGLGIGVAKVRANDVTSLGAAVTDASDAVVVGQGIAGLSYDVNANLALRLDYRYVVSQDAELDIAGGGGDFDWENSHHVAMLGFMYRFGAPAPKPAPAPVVAPAPQPAPPPPPPVAAAPRNYMVFFDWDKADIKPEAETIIRQAAENAQKGGTVRMTLTGHADRSGSDDYNVKLSQRRADNVKALLSRLGIAGGQVATVARGESVPLVPTADGVREPQNRRVEIVLQ